MNHALPAFVALLLASPALAAPTPRLFTNAETAKATAALKMRLVATKSCPRPVLRGLPKKGSSRTDLYALFEGKDACGVRITKLAAASKALGTNISKMMSDPAVLEFETACGEKLGLAVMNAAARESACSPYEIGVRDISDANITRYFVTAAMIGQHASTMASTRPVAALQLLLDGIRVFHDLTRGHTNAITHVLALNALNSLTQTAHDILETPIADPTTLIPAATELDALIASSPTVHSLLAGEGDALAFWTTAKKNGAAPSVQAPAEIAPADEKGLMLFVGSSLDQAIKTACPADASYAMCHSALSKVVGSTTNGTATIQKLLADLAAPAAAAVAPPSRLCLRHG